MKKLDAIKRKIKYRSQYRGIKEMDLLLGSFVKKYIDKFSDIELNHLEKLLFIEDEVIYKWYFQKNSDYAIPKTKVSVMLKNFKL